jgi:hypothetical protein
MYYTKEKSDFWHELQPKSFHLCLIVLTETHLGNSIENRDIELDSFDKNPQRKDRTNSGGGLLIYSKEDIGICRKHELENDIDETYQSICYCLKT